MSNGVTLSVVGLSAQEGTVVNVAANLLAALDISIKVLDSGDNSGDIVLVDGSSDLGRVVLRQLHVGQRVLLFVDNEGDANVDKALVRPVRVQTLRDAIADLMTTLPITRVPKSSPAAKSESAAAAAQGVASGALPGTLFYMLLEAVINQRMIRIDCGGGSTVLVHGPTQCIYTSADGMSLEKMSQQTHEMLKSQVLGESEFMHASKGLSLTRLHDVIWLAQRHGGRGQLLPTHSLDVPVKLKVWPKFNNRHVRPENLRLAALLSKQPITLRNLAESSGVALPQVIDFYNASVAFGVIEKSEAAPPVAPPKLSSSGGGLLGKIARRLALKRD